MMILLRRGESPDWEPKPKGSLDLRKTLKKYWNLLELRLSREFRETKMLPEQEGFKSWYFSLMDVMIRVGRLRIKLSMSISVV